MTPPPSVLTEFELARDFFKTPPGPPPKTPPALPPSWRPLVTERFGCLEDSDQPSQSSRLSATEKPPDDYQQFLADYFPTFTRSPLAEHHHRIWQWVWALDRGVRPRPLCAFLARGGAKSTTAELACVGVGARNVRSYVLYVSGKQDQADDHVETIAGMLESDAIGRAYPALGSRKLGKYGNSRGWRRNRIRTAAGLTVDALGLDVAARGAKLDEQRPDLIIFDDVDDGEDTVATVDKKVRLISQKLIPSGSPDLAILFVQNIVHHESVAARLAGLASEEADFMATREVIGPVPALRGLQYERGQNDAAGRPTYTITGGTPTWEGQGVAICQDQLNDMGLNAFLAEAQHERSRPKGQAFSEFDTSVHVVAPFKIPDSWPRLRAVDYGYAVPYCCLWMARGPSGRVYVYRETYATRKTAPQQALEIRVLSSGERYFASVGDPAMWAENREGIKYQSVAAQYEENGVKLIKATNNRLSGWTRLHSALEWTAEAPPMLQIFNTCPNLIRTLPLLTMDKDKPDDVDTTKEDHAPDTVRYGLQAMPWLDQPQGRKTRRMVVR